MSTESVGALLSKTLSEKHELEVRIAAALALIDRVPGDADYGWYWTAVKNLLNGGVK